MRRERSAKRQRMTSAIECAACGRLSLRAEGPCPACGGTDIARRKIPDFGDLVSWTVIRRPPKDSAETGPYVIAVVCLTEGFSLCGRVKASDFEGPVGTAMRLTAIENDVPVFERARCAR